MTEGYTKTFDEMGEALGADTLSEGQEVASDGEAAPRSIDEVLARAAARHHTSEEVQRAVLELEEKKRAVQEALVRDFEHLTETGKVEGPLSAREVLMREGRPSLLGKGGAEPIPVTEGDVAVAPLWDMTYRMGSDIPQELKERYLYERAARATAALRDRQIATIEANASYNKNSPTADTYNLILEGRGESAGLYAERMVKSFFIKTCIDADLPFTLEEVTIRDDVEGKVDFILHIKGHRRGAATVTGDDTTIGVQFTTSAREDTQQKKEKQLKRADWLERMSGEHLVDSRVLISLPLPRTLECVERWKKEKGRIPGGPEALWSMEEKEHVFRGVLSSLPAELGIDVDALWLQVVQCGCAS